MTTEEILANLILGIIGGLIAVPITLFFQLSWKNIFIPWFEERVYRDAHIEGKWSGTLKYDDGSEETFLFNIRRHSHKISGTMLSQQYGDNYIIQGEFGNMILTLSYLSSDPQVIDRGCFTFLLVNNGKSLQGYGTFYYDPENRVATSPLVLQRSN